MSTQTGTGVAHVYAFERRWQRYKLDLPLRVVVQQKDKTSIVTGRGTEISEGGLAVFAGTELRVGDRMFVEFTPPYSGKPLRVAATVRNRSGYNYGVEFNSETDEQRAEVSNFQVLLRFASGHPPS
jgi:hypothetical protein